MIDLHCHILPGLDDGAQTLDEALAMARIAVADGITDIVATPHTHNGLYMNKAEDILQAVSHLQEALNREGIPIRIHPGSEVHIQVELLENILSGETLTYGNHRKYVLLELPTLNLPRFMEQLLYELNVAGITPIIAHPERNLLLRENPELLANWVRHDAIAQLTAGSLLGLLGDRAKKAAEFMVKRRLIHMIASDGHNTVRRRPELVEAYRVVEKLMSKEEVQIYRFNTKAILRGENCTVLEPLYNKKKKWIF